MTGQVLGDALNDAEYPKARRESPTSLSTLQSHVHANEPCNHSQFEHDMSLPSTDLVLKAVKLAKGTQW